MITSARQAVNQIDGWTEAEYVVERHRNQWRVQVWRVVKPEARGRSRCVPWAVRGLTLNEHGEVVSYRNHL